MMTLKKITNTISQMNITNSTEHATIDLINLFPGIMLGINYVNIHRITGNAQTLPQKNVLRINYCFEGRCEVKLADGRYVYVDNNALCIEDHEPQYNFYYPLGFYRGIQIFLHLDELTKQTSDVFQLFDIRPQTILEKYCTTKQTFIQIASECFAQKSSEIMSVWENDAFSLEQKVQQIRFLLCYLFYYLINDEATDKTKVYNASTLSHSQYLIALDCEHQITCDLSKKLTIDSLAAGYKISPSSLKKFFTVVYGCSISEYTQTMRMKKAQHLMETTELSIMHIAASVGYENQSKFSAVFKKHTGYAPLEYKKIYTIKRNEETT